MSDLEALRKPELPAATALSSVASVQDRIIAIIAHECSVPKEKLVADATFDDIGVNSIDVVSTLNAVEEQFGVYIAIDQQMADVKTVGEMLSVLTSIVAKARNPEIS